MISAQAGGVTAAKAMKKAALPWCRKKCGHKTKSMRAKLCLICFQKQAAETGARSAGNQNKGRVKKLAGKRVTAAKAIKKAALPWCRKKCGRKTKSMRAKLCLICYQNQAAETLTIDGNQKGNPGNVGNQKGNPDNAGNQKKGASQETCWETKWRETVGEGCSCCQEGVAGPYIGRQARLGDPWKQDSSTWLGSLCREQGRWQTHGPGGIG